MTERWKPSSVVPQRSSTFMPEPPHPSRSGATVRSFGNLKFTAKLKLEIVLAGSGRRSVRGVCRQQKTVERLSCDWRDKLFGWRLRCFGRQDER
jgi:hypothetical protein